MTPTPEEVKDRVAVKHGLNWNEAIREYAELYHKSELDKASAELPSYGEIEKEFPTHGHYDDLINSEQLGKQSGADWMKQAASLVIAKVKHDLQSVIDHQSRSIINAQEKHEKLKNLYEESTDEYIAVRKYLEQKDKEIEELKGEINKRFDWAKNKEQRSLLSSKWNHKRLDERLSFTETIYCALNEYDEFINQTYFTNTKTK